MDTVRQSIASPLVWCLYHTTPTLSVLTQATPWMTLGRDQKHEFWLKNARDELQRQQQRLQRADILRISRQSLMLLTLEAALWEFLQQTLNTLPPESKPVLSLNLCPTHNDQYCRNLPSDKALLATARELARIVNNIDSLTSLHLDNAPTDIASQFLMTCSRLERLHFEFYPLVAATVRSAFSITTLRQLYIRRLAFSDSESIDAFCLGIEHIALEELSIRHVSFGLKHEARVATTLARSKTLVHFEFEAREISSFCITYCVALSQNDDTKIERLRLSAENVGVDLHGDRGIALGLDAAIMAEIRHFLELNVQRKTCSPLFAAIGDAETDRARREGLVEAFSAAGCPLTFECIRSNDYNLISLIQQLGRSGAPESSVGIIKKRKSRQKDKSEEDEDEYKTGGSPVVREDKAVEKPLKKSKR